MPSPAHSIAAARVERADRFFDRGIRAASNGIGPHPGAAAHVDDDPATDQVRMAYSHEPQRRHRPRLPAGSDVVVGDLEQRAERDLLRIVHEDVDGAELRDGRGDAALDVGELLDIAGNDDRAARPGS